MLFYNSSKILFFLCLTVYLVGCSPKIDIRGNFHDPDVLSEIKVGDISQLEVREILGTPSSITMFDQERWIYVSERTETLAFFEPVVKERKVIILNFNEQGIVSKIEILDAENGKKIQPVTRTTATSGSEFGFFQQLFGNMGRFNAPEDSGDVPGF
ncbi:MAG: cell envelope protein SmpA [Magnetovibrio sp.]|nr:cell envelope protein SmpA [Magnetovibrio sp.]|tara:strand:+ start:2426 stop:2893 length:468 start_codon:yes stop_codon:yes gene_type:complete